MSCITVPHGVISCRGGLVARPIHLFLVQGAIRIPRAPRRSTLRYRIHDGRTSRALGRRVGRSIVRCHNSIAYGHLVNDACSGRRKLCLTFCITYALTCALIQLPYFPVLILGRFLGGVSTSILFSVFESWLISASNSLALPAHDLSTIMGRASLVNGFVAAAAGVASNQLVGSTGSFASPFVASGILLLVAWIVIRGSWTENYGSGGGAAVSADPLQLRRLGQAFRIVCNGSYTSRPRAGRRTQTYCFQNHLCSSSA